MARSANSSGKDGDARVSSPAERAEIRELSLEEVLESYEQPINEEQAWAVCFQCCRELRAPRPPGLLIRGPSSIILHRDGTVTAHLDSGGEHLHSRRETSSTGSRRSLRVEEFLSSMHISFDMHSSCISSIII